MPANASDLSSSKYGYDFVVSTTQASINSGLLEYLSRGQQPVTYLCFLADPNTGNPSQEITLDDLLKKTNGVNPFVIPDKTPYNDPRIGVLTKALFVCGVKIQMGIPPGVLPKDLPAPVVVLGNSANNVIFNMYCSQFSVIQNTPSTGFGGTGSWNVWSQPPRTPWYVQTRVDLVIQDLDKELNTPYFNSHPDKKKAILAQLNPLSGTAFSLQQLLFDLDNAVMQSVPIFEGIPAGSNAEAILQKSFVSIYSTGAKQYGEPLLSVNTVSQSADPTRLLLTGYEREVSPLVDDNSGVPIVNPAPLQQAATTLNYLCAINHNPLPGAATFGWNWVEPTDIGVESGVIAINRNVIANYFLRQLLPLVRPACCNVTTSVNAHWWGAVSYYWTLYPGQPPKQAIVTPSGANVIHIEYDAVADNSDSQGATSGEFKIAPSYTCDVAFNGNTFTVVQHLVLYVYARWDLTGEGINVFDKTLTDVYTISVNENGVLQTSVPVSTTQDNSQDPNASPIANFFTNINDLVGNIKSQLSGYANTELQNFNFNGLQSFIFPGGKVFTYKSATFSDNQDLLCSITYVTTSQDQIPQGKRASPKLQLAHKSPAATRSLRTMNGITTLRTKTTQNANPAPSANATLKLTYSSDMMQNYLQGEIVSPQGKFKALQTDDGHTLLFATDTSGVLNAIEEENGKTHTGWVLTDLSSAVIKSKFPGATVRTFDAGQSVLDGTIGLAMAVSSGRSDNLFVSLSNSSADTSWIAKPTWTLYPFDAPGKNPATISITAILFSETIDNQQYLIVDIDRSQSSSVKDIARYYIDPSKSGGSYWVQHDVPIDIEDGSYQSCVGRAANAYVDGVYTSGMAGTSAQLVYVPIINVFGIGPPMPTRLSLPGGAAASAITAARNEDQTSSLYGTTDLYAVGGSTLYRFDAQEQNIDGAVGQPIITNSVLAGTDELIAMTHDGVTTLWGKNGSDAVYYLSCPTNQVSVPGSWSTPVPILVGIERVSAYVNRSDGGNTIFAAGGGKLQKLVQATDTSAKLWHAQEIKLAAPPQQSSLSFNSYTTTIQVADANGLPAKAVSVTISAKSRTPVYINGLYYMLGQTPVNVETDSAGSVTVIEATDNINGTILTVSADGSQTTTINPMDTPFKKLAALNTKDALKGATFPNNIKAGGVVGPSQSVPLVSPSTSVNDAKAVANNLGNLKTVYNGLNTPKVQLGAARTGPVIPSTALLASSHGIGNDIAIAAGDLYQLLKSGVQAVIQIVQDTVSDTWQFFATIAGQAYRAVLDTAEAVVGAVEWVFNAIKTAVEDIIHFIEFLFEWDDIRRTKDVINNMVKLYLQGMVSDVKKVQAAFDGQVAGVEKTVNQWAGIKDWSPLGAPAAGPANASTSNPAQGQTSGSRLLSNHFRDQASQMTVLGDDPSMHPVQSLIDDLLTAMSNEGTVLSAVYDQLQQLADDFQSMSVGDVLKRIAGILVDGILSSVQVVVDALLNVLSNLASAAIGILDVKIHVPIISDILNAIGIPDISFLDLFTWIAAVGYTVVYKIANDAAPFPDNADTNRIISAQDWNGLVALFNPAAARPVALSLIKKTGTTKSLALSSSLQTATFVAGHAIAGFIAFTGDFVNIFEANEVTGQNPWATLSAVMGIILAASAGAANALVPKDPIQNQAVSDFMIATTATVVLAKLVFSGPAQKQFGAPGSKFSGLAVKDGRATGAIVNAILVIPALFGTCWHFYELSEKPAGAERSAAIVGEVANLCGYVSRITYAVAVNDKDPESKAVEIGIMAVSNLAVAGLQTAEALIL